MPIPSPSQRRAIEAEPRALLVLAGPGAGKTFCLTERIGYLIEHYGFDPSRICAFTFTNKAAGEIAHRLSARLGDAAARITRGTLHAFCADLLRTYASSAGLQPGFGIADEAYQLSVLRRIEGPKRWHRTTLTRFAATRFRGEALFANDQSLFEKYERFLAKRNLVDFDQLVIRAAELLETSNVAASVRARWDVVLVDEFQDLNPVQYRVVRALARDHRHVFAVGDDDQSIYSWAGADPAVFRTFVNDFGVTAKVHLEENRRCPQNVFAVARTLVTVNTPIFDDRVPATADRASEYPVCAYQFDTDEQEAAWVVQDIISDRQQHGHAWGDVAVLYRTHAIGGLLEAGCLNAGVPCRLATGRALADDPVVAYVLAAARVIASPRDDVFRNAFFRQVLPAPLFDEALARAEEQSQTLSRQLMHMVAQLQRGDENARQIRRALADLRNLEAIGKRQDSLAGLLHDLLSRKVGVMRSVLDDHHDEVSDPATLPDVVLMAERLRTARTMRTPVSLAPIGGAEFPLRAMLAALGMVMADHTALPAGTEMLQPDDITSVAFPLGVFKAAQLLEMHEASSGFTDFTAVDLETTDRDTGSAEIVEIAAVRVRDGIIAETFSKLVKPRVAIAPEAMATHGIDTESLRDAPHFEAIWPEFRRFVGNDVIVAHNGYDFDFPILARMVDECGERFSMTTFDTLPLARDLFPTSRKLVDLAGRFGIDPGNSHRALDDTLTLARVTMELARAQVVRARKTALNEHLGTLGVALALWQLKRGGEEADAESALFLRLTRVFALGRYSGALEAYEHERGTDDRLPTVDDVIAQLGGRALMERIRAEKTADDRYPQAMLRLRRLIAELPAGSFADQLSLFLERAVLSKWQGEEPDPDRVNLLTLHSTKGLEFSRVYVIGVEDAQLPGGSPTKAPSAHEVEEGRRLLYVGMTRTIDRLVLTTASTRAGKPSGGHQFLDEMRLQPVEPP